MFKIFDAFKQGKSLTSSTTWKNVQIATNALACVLGVGVYILQMFVDIHITNEQILTLSGGIAAIVNVVITIITSDKVGLPNKENEQ
jgi:hypothetical protein